MLLTDPLEIDDLVLRVVYRFSCANCALCTEILEKGCVENRIALSSFSNACGFRRKTKYRIIGDMKTWRNHTSV